MNIDEYLNNLENDLDRRLSEFGMETSRQASPHLTSPEGGGTDDAMEEFKFCPECGNKVAGDAKLCPNCGYRFNADVPEAECSFETEISSDSDYDPNELNNLLQNAGAEVEIINV